LFEGPGEPVKVSAAELADLDHQWVAIKSGEPTVPHEDVVRRLDTWGTLGVKAWHKAAGRTAGWPKA
jgi:hypothetical protein